MKTKLRGHQKLHQPPASTGQRDSDFRVVQRIVKDFPAVVSLDCGGAFKMRHIKMFLFESGKSYHVYLELDWSQYVNGK